MSGVAAIVLAAGQGTRFGGEFKLLADLDGMPVVRRAVDAALTSTARPIIVVLGHRRAAVAQTIHDLDVTIVENPGYRDGLSTSLKSGFAALPPEAEAAIVLLGDMPRVNGSLINRLIDAWRAAERPSAAIPTLGGRRGNPVLLSQALASELMNLKGDVGAGGLLRSRSDVLEVETACDAIFQDVDTPEALTALQLGSNFGASI